MDLPSRSRGRCQECWDLSCRSRNWLRWYNMWSWLIENPFMKHFMEILGSFYAHHWSKPTKTRHIYCSSIHGSPKKADPPLLWCPARLIAKIILSLCFRINRIFIITHNLSILAQSSLCNSSTSSKSNLINSSSYIVAKNSEQVLASQNSLML